MDLGGASAFSRKVLLWTVWATVIAPVTVVLHELGHLAAGWALGAPDLVLHYASVSDTAEEAGLAPWKLGVQAIAGPAVTALLSIAACLYVRRRGPAPAAVALGVIAPVRYAVGIVYLVVTTAVRLQGGSVGGADFDEYNAARTLGFPVELLVLLESAFLTAVWIWMFRRLRSGQRLAAGVGLLLGAVLGLLLWIGAVGPVLLP